MKQPLTLALLCVIIAVIVADDAIATLRASLATNKNDFDLNWDLAGELTRRGQNSEALNHVAACLRQRPSHDVAWTEFHRLQHLAAGSVSSAVGEPNSGAVTVVDSPAVAKAAETPAGDSEAAANTADSEAAASTADSEAAAGGSLKLDAAWIPPTDLGSVSWTPSVAGFRELYKDVLCPCHKAADGVKRGYQGFFNHISLRKGWRTVPFKQDDLKHIFQVAAEVVGLLRTRLDLLKKGLTLRQVDGSSHEVLWGLEKNPRVDLPGQDAAYVLSTIELLVVATLSDAHGLVEGLERPVVMQSVEAHPFVQHLRTIV